MSMSTTCNDVYLGLLDNDYFGLLGDDAPGPPPLPQGSDLPRKPPDKDYWKHSTGEWSNGGITSLLDKDIERFKDLRGGLVGMRTPGAMMSKRGPAAGERQELCTFCCWFQIGTSLCTPDGNGHSLRLGGSVLAGSASENVDPKMITLIAREVQVAVLHGVHMEFRMKASVMNAVLLQASLENIGIEARVQTTLVMKDAAEPYIRRRAMCHLEKGRVVIFGGIGAAMGNPLLTTDTAAALRASEINADVLLNGITGDGNAGFEHISYRQLVARGICKMDVKAATFCEENILPFVLFNMLEPGNMSRALCGVETLVDQTGRAPFIT